MGEKPIKVLLIEDSVFATRHTQKMLAEANSSQFNAQLECADQLSVGLKRLAEDRIDIVLLDLTLPDSHDLDTFTSVHAQAPEMPIIVLTGLEDEKLAVEAVGKGAQDYLVKGQLDSNLLKRSMLYAIERKKVHEELRKSREHLEELVEERTAQLKKNNEELRKEITERKQAEGKLKESEEDYRKLIETSPYAIFVHIDQKMIFMNPAGLELIGAHNSSEVIGKSILDLTHPDYLEVIKRRQELLKKGEAPRNEYFKALRLDGSVIDVETTSARVTYQGKSAIMSTIRDITDRIKAEEKTKLAYAELNQIFNTAADGMRVIDKDFNTFRVNETFLNLVGVGRDEVLSKKCYEIFHCPSCDTPDCPLTRILAGDERVEYEVEIERRDGTKVPCIVTGTPLRYPDGELIGIVEDFKDITERKQAEKALRRTYEDLERAHRQLEESQAQLIQTEKMSALGTLVAGTAHELNNPIMGILNFSAHCLKHTSEEDRLYTVLQDTEREAKHCAEIVRNLLTFSHMEKDDDKAYKKESLAEILGRVLKLLSYRIEKQRILVTQHIADDTPKIWIKPNRIQQLILNLATNAFDALEGSEKKEFNVDIHREREFVRMKFADTGCGIAAESLTSIFDPFFTTKLAGQGTGLGLSVSQGIVKAHGGEITCQSEPGAGTKFTILLPIKQPVSKAEEPVPAKAAPI